MKLYDEEMFEMIGGIEYWQKESTNFTGKEIDTIIVIITYPSAFVDLYILHILITTLLLCILLRPCSPSTCHCITTSFCQNVQEIFSHQPVFPKLVS